MSTGELTAEQLAQRAFDLNLLDERQLHDVWAELGRRNVSADELAQLLVRRELLTNFQLERLLRGEKAGYFYGDYKVLYLIAAGSFARVYRAVHKDSGKVVAVKVLRRRYSEDPQQREQFAREGNVVKGLLHTNIVPIYEVHGRGATLFLVMEFVEGCNLRELLRGRKKLTPEEATRIVHDVAAGLKYALEKGVSHRDMKLTNVIVSSRMQAKLVDFGLGADEHINEDTPEESASARAIDYAGLERMTGARKNDPRSDLYFLGCIYYHLLTGRAPLVETKDRIQRLSKSRFQEVTPIHKVEAGLPRAVVHVVNKSMALEPDKRYQTPNEMLVDLKIALTRLHEPHDAVDAETEQALEARMEAERQKLAAILIPESQKRTLMFVESNVQFQDTIRDLLKKTGYKVLVTRDPQFALKRLAADSAALDGVVFSTGELGAPALEAFNAFGEAEAGRDVPAVLLLGEGQAAWLKKAKLDKHRVAISMPVKLKEFRAVLTALVPPMPEASPQA
jgi:serine/threonine protein kinase